MFDVADVQELARIMYGLAEDAQEDEINSAVMQNLDVDIGQFTNVVEALIPYTLATKSALTDTLYQGFVDGHYFIVKQRAMPEVE